MMDHGCATTAATSQTRRCDHGADSVGTTTASRLLIQISDFEMSHSACNIFLWLESIISEYGYIRINVQSRSRCRDPDLSGEPWLQ